MALVERLANLGYMAIIPEATPGTALTPNVFIPAYKATMNTDIHMDVDNIVAGVRSGIFNQFEGIRSHEGQIEVLAEANTAEYWFDMLLAAGNITGGGPYTHPFTEGLSKSYTMDILKGQIVERYRGVMAESIEPVYDKNKMKFQVNISALGSFISRKIATISTVTLTLDTAYDPAPNKGLVVGDLVRIMKADGSTTLDTTIATSGVNADGITIVLNDSAASFSAGDYIFLRPQSPSLASLRYPFTWARTEFRFGSSASAALSAAHSPHETGSKWKLSNKFEKKQGSDRSGSYDPASLVRTQTEAELDLKRFFDQPQGVQRFQEVGSESCVVRMFSEAGYELRVTFNTLKYQTHKRDFDTGKIIYADIKGMAQYNTGDGQMFDVKILNALAA